MRARPLNVEHLELLPEGRGWLVAEVGADDAGEADATRRGRSSPTCRPASTGGATTTPSGRPRVWLVRESGLGGDGDHARRDATTTRAGRTPRSRPEQLGTYLRAITALWAEFGYSGALVRPLRPGLRPHPQQLRLRTTGRACAPTARSSSGPPTSSSRSAARCRVSTATASRAASCSSGCTAPSWSTPSGEFKAVFDPRGRMNPGKLVDAYPLDTNLRYGPGLPAAPRRAGRGSVFGAGGRSLQARGRAMCRRREVPARRRRHDVPVVPGDARRASLDARSRQAARRDVPGRDDAGHLAQRATCATRSTSACRARAARSTARRASTWPRTRPSSCPTTTRAGSGRGRCTRLALLPWIARAVSRVPWLPNAVLGAPGLGSGRASAGRDHHGTAGSTLRRAARSAAARSRPRDATTAAATVVVWPDTFTDAFRPGVADDLVAVLEALGERVAVPSAWACCGRPLYDAGMLGLARRTLTHLLDVLEPWTSRGIPVVVLEPSCLAAFRDELPALLADDPRAARARLAGAEPGRAPARLAASRGASSGTSASPTSPTAPVASRHEPSIHPALPRPGHRDAALPTASCSSAWASGRRSLDAGCCGLAGSFGYRAEHEPLSRQIGRDAVAARGPGALARHRALPRIGRRDRPRRGRLQLHDAARPALGPPRRRR